MWLAICVNILDYLWSPLSLTAKKMVTSADPWPWPRGDCSLVSLSMVWWTKSTSSDHTLKICICVPGCWLILNLRKKIKRFLKPNSKKCPISHEKTIISWEELVSLKFLVCPSQTLWHWTVQWVRFEFVQDMSAWSNDQNVKICIDCQV